MYADDLFSWQKAADRYYRLAGESDEKDEEIKTSFSVRVRIKCECR